MGLNSFDGYHPYEQVDELASVTDMTGDASAKNQRAGAPGWFQDPTRGLVLLWVIVLALYWLIGYAFRGVRA